jgi:response regulator RpfG family c-di-GMP phosphodiesterase
MWKKKPSKSSFIDNCIKSIATINQILKEGDYWEETVPHDQKIKVSIEDETDTVMLELKLCEQKVSEFISNLKCNSLTKHIPILKITNLNTQLFWDQLNLSGNCFTNAKPGRNPWLLVKINSVVQ